MSCAVICAYCTPPLKRGEVLRPFITASMVEHSWCSVGVCVPSTQLLYDLWIFGIDTATPVKRIHKNNQHLF